MFFFFFSSRRRHTRLTCDWSSDVCSSDLTPQDAGAGRTEPAVSLFFAGPGEAKRAAKSTREGQAENSLFRRRKEGVCSLARDRETERAIAGGGYSHSGSAEGTARVADGGKNEM